MIRKKGGLGRGLDALLGAGAAIRNQAPPESTFAEMLCSLPVEQIVRGRGRADRPGSLPAPPGFA